MSRKRRFNLSGIIKDISHTAVSIEKPIAKVISKEIGAVEHLGLSAIKGVGGIASSLTLPLLVVGIAGIIYVANKK